jgi:hypothetical protein
MNTIINNIIYDKYELYNIKTRLTIYDKQYLVYLFNNQYIMNKLDIFLDEIFENDKLYFHDIPKIVLFVSNLCIENKNNYNINIINIIKIILEIIIFISFEKNNDDIIIINDIMDTSINLLKINPYKYNFLKIINWCY